MWIVVWSLLGVVVCALSIILNDCISRNRFNLNCMMRLSDDVTSVKAVVKALEIT